VYLKGGKNIMNYIIDFRDVTAMNDEQFYQLCLNNPEIKFELNEKGELIIMPPTGGETGNKNAEINAEFVLWNRQYKLGKVFDSSTCFKFPNGAKYSPDVAWIKLERWNQLNSQEKEKFPPLAPDFVLELISPTDILINTQNKMVEYINNGVKLGWLINPNLKIVEIYRQGKETEILNNTLKLSGENILPQFTLDLGIIW
jgi:Uma2 family endonuclease